MAEVLLNCEPLCGLPWRLSLASEAREREEVFRLRSTVFLRDPDGRDVDEFDSWCDHLMLRDEAKGELIGTYRLIPGPRALARGRFYSGGEFDLTPLTPIAADILEIGRACVAPPYRNGAAVQFLWYGLVLMLRRTGLNHLLGCGSFRVRDRGQLNTVDSFVRRFHADPEFRVRPLPRHAVCGLSEVAVDPRDEFLLPSLVRGYLKMGTTICSPPAWDPDLGCYDLLLLFRQDRPSPAYRLFNRRMDRNLEQLRRRSESVST